MYEANHNLEGSNRSRRIRTSTLAIFFCLASIANAQLPAGTRDASSQTETQQDPLRAKAADALNKQDYATAVTLLTQLAAGNPKDAQVLYNLGLAQDALDHTADAESAYRRATAAGPNFLEPHLALGLLLARAGKPSEARTELTAAAVIPNGDANLRARAYRALARIDQDSNPSAASDELLNAIKLSSETPEDILLTGELAEANGDPTSAEAAYRRLLAADPDNTQATAALVHLLISQKKLDQAEPLLQAALQKHPGDPILISQLASVYDAQNKPEEAIPLVQKLHAAQPQDAAIARLLARLYVRNGNYEKAMPLYKALTAASPNDPTLLDDQADALIRLRQPGEAETLLKRAIADPTAFPSPQAYGSALSHLAFAASNNNDPATVLQAIDLRAKVLPPTPSTIFLAAAAHDKLHQVKEASDLYKQFLAASQGQFPDEEWEARHRLSALQHMR